MHKSEMDKSGMSAAGTGMAPPAMTSKGMGSSKGSSGMEGAGTGNPAMGSPAMTGSPSKKGMGKPDGPPKGKTELVARESGTGRVGGAPPPDQPTLRLPTVRKCATMDVHRRLLRESPEYARARARIETQALEYARRARTQQALRTGIAHIPVVVHVVWNTAAEDISDAQIQSQIDVLNRDFRKLNPDVSQVPSVWQGLVADAGVDFHLATHDPNGNPTNGITRTQTSATSFSDDDRVKSAATGGADAWPSDKYLNIWVCQLSGGLLGYAQFPGGPAATDGVVITHTGFGTTGTAAAPFNLGRSATHEIGHWLNLLHIWGDDGTGCTGSDQVSDTPNQAGPNFGVPAFPHVTCSNAPNGDMFMNYMDYVDDNAMVMFTNGQKLERMDPALEGPRSSFLTLGGDRIISPSGPVVSWGPNRLDAFVLGSDSALYHKWWDGSAWGPAVTGYEYMGGICSAGPEVVSWGPNRLDAFVLGTDLALYHKWWNGSAWGPSVTDYEYMGGICVSPPKVASWAENRLDVFVLGTDHALYHKYWNGSAWGPSVTDYERLGGICVAGPEVVAWGPNRLDVFVLGTDHALYHKWWDGSAWGPSVNDFEFMGGVCASPPKVVSWGPNRLDVFVLGTDHALYHKWWDGSAWGPSVTGWEYMGGICEGTPEVVAWGPNRLDVFVLGTDSAVYHKWWDGSAWGPSVTDYEYLGGVCASPPDALSWGANRLDVFVVGEDSALYHKWWDGSAWGPSVTGWEYMGGIVTALTERGPRAIAA